MIQVLMITAYEFTGEEIGKIKSKQYNQRHAYKILPEYCINPETGKLRITEEYLYYVQDGDEKYYLLDYYTDGLLYEEISLIGMEDAFKDIDFRKIVPYINIINYDDLHKVIPTHDVILMKLTFEGEREDTESYLELFGVLRANGNIIKLEGDES